jgi:DNA-binding MurR/RpiR family transcriptional regulator
LQKIQTYVIILSELTAQWEKLMKAELSLEEHIKASLPTLTPKQKRLARLALEDRSFFAFASASQVGKETSTSAATVVRFAQTIGYAGFPELQNAIRLELPHYLTAVERMQARLAAPTPPEDVYQQVFYYDIRNVQQTAENLSTTMLDEVIHAIVASTTILVVGSGLSAGLAIFLAHSLRVIGFEARALTGHGLSLASEVAQVDADTLLIAIDLRRHVRSTLESVKSARRGGATTVAITDNRVSRLARRADYVFEVAAEGYAHSLSTTGAMSLLNVIIAELSYRLPERTLESLRRVDETYRQHNLLVQE